MSWKVTESIPLHLMEQKHLYGTILTKYLLKQKNTIKEDINSHTVRRACNYHTTQ